MQRKLIQSNSEESLLEQILTSDESSSTAVSIKAHHGVLLPTGVRLLLH